VQVLPAGPDILLLRSEHPAPPGWEVANLYLLGQSELTLVDAGYPHPQAAGEVLAVIAGRPLGKIILTHGHTDHAGAAAELRRKTGAKILCHPRELGTVQRRFRNLAVDQEVKEGDLIPAEGRSVRVVETPGHSPGHIALWIEDDGTLFTGDLVTGAGSTFVGPPEGDMTAYMHSLDKVLALPARRLLPGHGPLVAEPQQRIRELITHRQLRELQIGKILEPGPHTLAEMVEQAYAGLIHPGLYGAATMTLLAHLDKLVREGKVGFRPPAAAAGQRTYFLSVPKPLPY
jgi:glyoxylase-like metal-dependent hydrolase (beta-lactamase superfamily II)